MRASKPPRALINQAAELRAAGSSWEAVAREVGRTLDTVRRWPTLYKSIWKEAIQRAEEQLLTETTAESVFTLRRQLRSEDDKSSRDAAEKLIKFRLATKPKAQVTTSQQPSSDAGRIVRYLEGLTDAQLEELIAQLSQRATPSKRSVPAEGDSPSSAQSE